MALGASGCSAAAADESVYRLGVITSQTGAASQLGLGELQGAQLAADTINARGGINGRRIQLVVADDQSTPVQAVLQARRMIGNVDAVVGPSVSSTCNAVTPLAESSRTVVYCLSPGIKPKPNGHVWSASVATSDLIRRALEHWRAEGITRVAILNSTDASGQEGAASLQKAAAAMPGTQVVGAATFEPGAVSVTSQLQALLAARPQALIVWSTGAAAAVALKGISQLSVQLPVATTDGNLTYAFLRRVADYTPQTLLIPATQDFWWQQSDRPAPARELEEAYHRDFEARFGSRPDFGPGVAYDAVLVLADALAHGSGEPTTLKETLERRTGVVGVVGTYNFSPGDHRGLSLDDVAMVRVHGGGFVPEKRR
ncbi:ABC transporter substrate-binding protein [Pseudonocardia acidicola]|uniref:ABC transporter substrate-binding protein n=1 Tax=Pseudonocardia acidicola TaxID=2724939 RepID=A0ABX1SG68_9PSEU|nr:ABC transporter substrate-binding protein [Pseudonocardia acidicola]NMH99872.1 ABC transporter substrate-binding protein [Pseudonocardia acidicola]